MKFTDLLWENALPTYEQILLHPFNQEMKEGTLPVEKFKFYIYQDSLYLADFAKALALTGTKSGSSHELLDFLQFAQNAIIKNMPLISRAGNRRDALRIPITFCLSAHFKVMKSR
jgi:thiaminase/transcriptional activator TenA